MTYPEIKLNTGKAVTYQGKEYVLVGKVARKTEHPFIPLRFEGILFDKERNAARFAPIEEIEAIVALFGYRSPDMDAEDALQEMLD